MDQPYMRVGLREIAEQPAGARFNVLRKKSNRIRVRRNMIEDLLCAIQVSGQRKSLCPPEGADRE